MMGNTPFKSTYNFLRLAWILRCHAQGVRYDRPYYHDPDNSFSIVANGIPVMGYLLMESCIEELGAVSIQELGQIRVAICSSGEERDRVRYEFQDRLAQAGAEIHDAGGMNPHDITILAASPIIDRVDDGARLDSVKIECDSPSEYSMWAGFCEEMEEKLEKKNRPNPSPRIISRKYGDHGKAWIWIDFHTCPEERETFVNDFERQLQQFKDSKLAQFTLRSGSRQKLGQRM